MTKNYIIPKDNIPKIAEVREVENQTLTYEEFLKNYQVDQKVSSSYENEIESYNDVGVSKGFGPCRWNNSRCSCRPGENWVDLRVPCLVEGCANKKFVNWFHSKNSYFIAVDRQYGNCGMLEMSNKSRIQCKGCGDVGNMDDWKIACSSYHGSSDSDIRFLDASVAFAFGIDGAKTQLGFDIASFKVDGVQARVGFNVDTGVSTSNDSLEVKAGGFGFSVGRQTGVSTPFGEVKVDADECSIQ